MQLTESLSQWIDEAERMDNGAALAVVLTEELFVELVREQESTTPVVGGLPVYAAASVVLATDERPPLHEMVEVTGPDRVCIYVGQDPTASTYPFGYDPAMPVFCVPVPPATLADGAALEMYNRLRWYGLAPDEALAGSGG